MNWWKIQKYIKEYVKTEQSVNKCKKRQQSVNKFKKMQKMSEVQYQTTLHFFTLLHCSALTEIIYYILDFC